MYVYVVHYTQVYVTIAYTQAEKYLLASLGFLLLILCPAICQTQFFYFFFFFVMDELYTRVG